jgi:glycosidase
MIALGCLFGLQGIPCVYYGTEQGLNGAGEDEEIVRQALWGAPDPFDRTNPFYLFLKKLSEVRANYPALRYGRQYFRPIATDSLSFGIPNEAGKPITFSRVLCYQEVLVVANPNLESPWSGQVIVDVVLNADEEPFDVLMSNKLNLPGPVKAGTYPDGRARHIPITLRPGEIQIIANRN